MVARIESPDYLIQYVSGCVSLSSFPPPTLLVMSKERGHNAQGYFPPSSESCRHHSVPSTLQSCSRSCCCFERSKIPHLLLKALHRTAIYPKEKLKPLIRLPTKAQWTSFHTGIALTSSPAVASTAKCCLHFSIVHTRFCRAPSHSLPSSLRLVFSEAARSLLSAFPSVSL